MSSVLSSSLYLSLAIFEIIDESSPPDKNVASGTSLTSCLSIESFTEAGKHGYWGAECDVYRTKDGVWIISHDSHTYRMMDKSAFIEKKTYEELMDMNVDNGVNIDKYEDLKICSLEEYLDICKKYNMTPVIELKGKNNTEYYSEIVELANQFEVNPVYISFL